MEYYTRHQQILSPDSHAILSATIMTKLRQVSIRKLFLKDKKERLIDMAHAHQLFLPPTSDWSCQTKPPILFSCLPGTDTLIIVSLVLRRRVRSTSCLASRTSRHQETRTHLVVASKSPQLVSDSVVRCSNVVFGEVLKSPRDVD